MSNRRFIEITSVNRNRHQYPQPAQFEVPFAPPRSLNTNQNLRGAFSYNNITRLIYSQNIDVADTVTSGIVEYQWYGQNQLYDTGIISSSTPISLTVSGLSKTYVLPNNYYIVLNNQIITPCQINSSTSISYTYTSSIPLILPDNLPFQILTNNSYYDTSTLQTTVTSTISKFYVNVASLTSPYKNIPNFYVGYSLVLNNVIAGTINSYTPSTGLFTVELPLLSTINPSDPVYIIDPSNGSDTTKPLKIVLPLIDCSGKTILSYDQSYNDYYLIDETQSLLYTASDKLTNLIFSKIVSFDFTLNTVTLESPLTNWNIKDKYTIRKTLPKELLITAPNPSLAQPTPVNNYDTISISSNCIFLPQYLSKPDNFYNGQYIYVYPNQILNNQTTSLQNIEGSCFYIQSYIGDPYNACIIGEVSSPFVKNPSYYYPSYQNSKPSLPLPGTCINIVSFSNDNYNPLMYNGSTVSQNETVAYEISLVNLTLPNLTLVTGSRASFYPYVYVEIANATAASSSSKNIIYSNNPNSTDALFIVPITDINDPIRSTFIKLDGGSMTQTVKFKPNDCLRFSVYLPNGKLYQTIMSDYYSPSGPNPFTQIDALFGIKRLTGV